MPPTGRTLTRSLETSVTLGAMTTATSSCSRSQASRRMSDGGVDRTTGEEDHVGLGVDGDLGDRAGRAQQRDAGVGHRALAGLRE